jgi:drug/metabolite transporter (DMT)-like permease
VRTRIPPPAAAALLTTIVIWGFGFAAIRVALPGYGPLGLSLARLVVASVVLIPIAALRGVRSPPVRDLPVLMVTSFCGMTAYQLLINRAEVTVSSGTTGLLAATSPALTALSATVLLRERLTTRGWVGLLVALTGVSVISVAGSAGIHFESAALLVLLAGLSQSCFFLIQKRLLTRYTSLALTTYAMTLGAVMLIPFCTAAAWQGVQVATTRETIALLFLGAGPSALGFGTLAFACSRMDVSLAATTLYATPVFAFLAGWLLLSEIPTPGAIVGGVLALSGVLLATTEARPSSPLARS